MTAMWASVEVAAQQPPAAGSAPFVRAVPARNETVTSRRRPQYDPVGIRRGSFFIYPSFEVAGTYDSNIFATSTDRKQDFLVILSPEIAIRSNWRRHQFNIGARADIGRYKSHHKENYEDASGVITGRYDISGNTYIFGGANFALRHEDRGSPDDVDGKVPTKFWVAELAGGAQHRFGRFTVRLSTQVRLLDFKDVAADLASGTELIDNDDRDRREWTGTVRLTYLINPRISVFGQITGSDNHYYDGVDSAGLQRDNTGVEGNIGIAIELTGKLVGEAFAGVSHRWYRDPTLPSITGPSGGLSLTWTPTGLTTLTAAVVRSIEETTQAGASGFYSTNVRLSIDHELRRNVLLNGFGSYQHDDFRGIARNDQWFRAGMGATFLINRNANLFAGYEFTRLIAGTGGESFTRHLVILRIKGQL
jgi:hypothetical protein